MKGNYFYTPEVLERLEAFMEYLSQLPDEKEILRNIVTETDYIPIDIIEAKFDRLVLGQYSFKNFKWQIGQHKEVGSIELEFCHPITSNWLTRTGACAIEIENKQVPVGEGKIKTFSVELSHPACLSLCKVSAIRQVGVLFGRSLNRDIVDMQMSDKIAKSTELQKALDELFSMSSIDEIQKSKLGLIEKYKTLLNDNEMTVLNNSITNTLMDKIRE